MKPCSLYDQFPIKKMIPLRYYADGSNISKKIPICRQIISEFVAREDDQFDDVQNVPERYLSFNCEHVASHIHLSSDPE